MYPLVRELAAGGIPVTVTCRVLKIARQPYYRWRKHQVTESELVEAYRANALLDAHRDDPEYGYRFLVGEAAEVGARELGKGARELADRGADGIADEGLCHMSQLSRKEVMAPASASGRSTKRSSAPSRLPKT